MVLSPGSAEAPAGYPYKNSNNRKNRKHAGDTKRPLGRREGMVGYLTCSSVEGFGGWWEGGVLNKCLYGEAPPA